jgi:putative intracellular protease/amidase
MHCFYPLIALMLSLCGLAPVFAATPLPPDTAPSMQTARVAPYQARAGRTRPLIAVVGENTSTELTDFVVPYAILTQADAADVLAVATRPGPLQMRPAVRIQPHTTIALFDTRFPDGADYVIVPAVGKPDDPGLVSWLRQQADKGATIVSICDGALAVGKAGLFKGHRATGHWATQSMRESEFPETTWLKNTRYVADGKIISSAGISAAIPLSLALVEAIAGSTRAAQLADEIGQAHWNTAHDSEQFQRWSLYLTGARNWFARAESIGIPLAAGVDDIALALSADAFSRTYRSQAYTLAASPDGIVTRHGLTVLPDRIWGDGAAPDRIASSFATTPSARVLDEVLKEISAMYGGVTAKFVADQLEYSQVSR